MKNNNEANNSNPPENGVSRRQLLSANLIKATAATVAAKTFARPAMARTPRPARKANCERPLLVVAFQRGGADGLTQIAPHDDSNYEMKRQNIRIHPPGTFPPGDENENKNGLHLQDAFGDHPEFSVPQGYERLVDLYKVEKKLAIIHACGCVEDNRSHFIMQDLMERADVLGVGDGLGWLARLMNAVGNTGALRALHFGNLTAAAYKGSASGVVPTSSPMEFAFPGNQAFKDFLKDTLYTYHGNQPLLGALTEDLEAETKLNDPLTWQYLLPIEDTDYPATTLGQQFQLTAAMAKTLPELEVVSIDYDNIAGQRWDTHDSQGPYDGTMYNLMVDFGGSLRAFYDDMKAFSGREVCVIAMTEFGRTLQENSSMGTDHGRGGVCMVLGDQVKGGKVYGAWPGLTDDDVDDKGDMVVANDIRHVQAEIADELFCVDWDAVITDPGYSYDASVDSYNIFGLEAEGEVGGPVTPP